MTHSTVTHAEALRRLLAATKLIDYADCKDETVWQALGAAQGTAEGVLRDGEPTWKCAICGAKSANICIANGCAACEQDGSTLPDLLPGQLPTDIPWRKAQPDLACYILKTTTALDGDQLLRTWNAMRDYLSAAPQPAAAPSGDVERKAIEPTPVDSQGWDSAFNGPSARDRF